MLRVISTEFLKLRRSRLVIFVIVASFLPEVVKYLQYTFGKDQATASWQWFLASGQEFMVLLMITLVVSVSSFVFSLEYQYNTASYIFTSSTSKTNIFIAKAIALFFIIALAFLSLAFSELLLSYLALKTAIPGQLFLNFLKVIGWYILSYYLLSLVVVMLTVFIRKFIIVNVVVLGYIMLVFPFHLKNNLYISPFMIPTVVAAKIYGSANYIFTDYYKDVSINNIQVVVFLVILAMVTMIIGMRSYKNQDAIK